MDEESILSQIKVVKGKIAFHEEELSDLKGRYEAIVLKKMADVLENKSDKVEERKPAGQKTSEKMNSSLTPSRNNRTSSSSSDSGNSRKNRWFDSDVSTRNDGPRAKQQRSGLMDDALMNLLQTVRGRSLKAFERTKIITVKREMIQGNVNNSQRTLERFDITFNNIDFAFDIYRANKRDSVHNALSFLTFSDTKHAHYLRAKIEIRYLNRWDNKWLVALCQIYDIEIVKGAGNTIDAFYDFGDAELFTILHVQRERVRGYQGIPRERVKYSVILEKDSYLARMFNRKELTGSLMTSVKRLTVFNEEKRALAKSKLKTSTSTANQGNTVNRESTSGWGNSSNPDLTTSGWGISSGPGPSGHAGRQNPSPLAWGSPTRSESIFSQSTGPLIPIPAGFQFQIPQVQGQSQMLLNQGQQVVPTPIQNMNQGIASYQGHPGLSGPPGQQSSQYPLVCPPFHTANQQGPPGPLGSQGAINAQGQPNQHGLQGQLIPQDHHNMFGPQSVMFGPQPMSQPTDMNDPKSLEKIEGPLDLSKSEKIDSIKKGFEQKAQEIEKNRKKDPLNAPKESAQGTPVQTPAQDTSGSPSVQSAFVTASENEPKTVPPASQSENDKPDGKNNEKKEGDAGDEVAEEKSGENTDAIDREEKASIISTSEDELLKG